MKCECPELDDRVDERCPIHGGSPEELGEREIIVAWLRNVVAGEPDSLTTEREVGAGDFNTSTLALDADKIADAIERGEHHGAAPPETPDGSPD